MPSHRRITNRRHDPLRSRTPADWLTAFSSTPPTIPIPALAAASRRVWWDYPASGSATEQLRKHYLTLRIAPAREYVHAALVHLGYSPYFADRALSSYAEYAPINTHLDRVMFGSAPRYAYATETP